MLFVLGGCVYILWQAVAFALKMVFAVIFRTFWLLGQAFLLEAKFTLWASVHVPMAAARIKKWWVHKPAKAAPGRAP